MLLASRITMVSRTEPTVRAIARAWRALTGGKGVRDGDRRTLIACSGGADSSALAIALAAAAGKNARERIVVAHVVHDLRPRAQALADRDATKSLAAALGLAFVEASVKVRGKTGNLESLARRARYRALVKLARAQACPFVATAHHGDDQLETLLMRLVRGSGAAGLRGVHASRPLADGVVLIRPMLGLTRAQARKLCGSAGWVWREDQTNADQTRLRAAIRHQILPAIEKIAPKAGKRASRIAQRQAEVQELVREQARELWSSGEPRGDGRSWARARLRKSPAAVVGELLAMGQRELVGRRGDRVLERTLAPVVKAVRSSSGEPRKFDLAGLVVDISRTACVVEPRHKPRGVG